MLEDMETIGLKNERVVVKSDQEPAIVEVMKEVQRRRESDYGTALDNSRVGDSDSNGTIESMVGLAEGMARVLRFSIEDRIGTKLKMSDPIMPWLVRHAGHVLTRSRIRENGRTAMQLIKGRRSNTELVPFGESVLFRIPHGKSKPGKFEEQWEFGVYVGFVIRSGESLVATKDGVFRATSIRRRPSSERWSKAMLDEIRGTPGNPVPGSSTRRAPAFAKKFGSTEERTARTFAPQALPERDMRSWPIKKQDIEDNGPTDNCPGCKAALRGGKAAHTIICRNRFEAILMQTEEGRARIERADERIAQEIVRRTSVEAPEASQQGGESGGQDAAGAPSTSNSASASASAPASASTDPAAPPRVAETPDPGPPRPTRDTSSDPLAQRLRQAANRKRPADTTADDSGRGDDQAAHGAASSSGEKRSGPEDGDRRRTQPHRRGEKRGADEEPDDPRAADTDKPEISVLDKRRQCGCCQAKFESRNKLFDHIREERHVVVSDDEDEHSDVDAMTKPGSSKGHPGQKVDRADIRPKDREWRHVGSGIVVRSFENMKRLLVSTKSGPPLCEIKSRRVWSLSTGKLIDECEDIEEVPDKWLNRELPYPDNVKIELTLRNAEAEYKKKNPDIAEIYSQPRICSEAAGQLYQGIALKPGWSLDLTMKNPETNELWDLADRRTQDRVLRLVRETQPFCVVGSPPCTPFSQIQNINKRRRSPEIIKKEFEAGRRHILFCLKVYEIQLQSGRHFIHEHPKGSSA